MEHFRRFGIALASERSELNAKGRILRKRQIYRISPPFNQKNSSQLAAGIVNFLDFLYFRHLNSGRRERFQEECRVLRSLPNRRLNDCKRERVKVGPSSTIRLQHNIYSVQSSLMGEWVEARLYAEQVEVWYDQSMIERMPLLRGEKNHWINYRHVIDWLVRKPGAFAQYRYRDDLFPTSRYRMAYDLQSIIAWRVICENAFFCRSLCGNGDV